MAIKLTCAAKIRNIFGKNKLFYAEKGYFLRLGKKNCCLGKFFCGNYGLMSLGGAQAFLVGIVASES